MDGMGLQTTGHPVVIQFEPASGVMIHITPLSIFTTQALLEKGAEKLPYPDPEPYRLPLPNAVDESIKIPATDNPEYRALMKQVNKQRDEWLFWAYIDLACTFPAYPTREDLIAHFRPRLEMIGKYTDLDDDEWKNVINHCVLTGLGDKQIIINATMQDLNLPLSAPEVVEGMRFFRVEVSRNGFGKVARPPRRAEEQGKT